MTTDLNSICDSLELLKITKWKSASSVLVETRVIMFSHYFLISMIKNEKILEKYLTYGEIIRAQLQNKEEKLSEYKATTYLFFSDPQSTSIYDFINNIFYIGETEQPQNKRLHQHELEIEKAYKNDGDICLPIYKHASLCLKNNINVFYRPFKFMINKDQSFFTEYSTIAFVRSFLQNQNQKHGNTKSFKNILSEKKIKHKTIVKIGCAEIIDFHRQNNKKFCYFNFINIDQKLSFSTKSLIR
ncbi:MAG: hypothetical protein ACQPRI_06035 [Solitalea-like symbiont of Tyrophagus putrescentiae]